MVDWTKNKLTEIRYYIIRILEKINTLVYDGKTLMSNALKIVEYKQRHTLFIVV